MRNPRRLHKRTLGTNVAGTAPRGEITVDGEQEFGRDAERVQADPINPSTTKSRSDLTGDTGDPRGLGTCDHHEEHLRSHQPRRYLDGHHSGRFGFHRRAYLITLKQRHDTAKVNNPESRMNWAGLSIRERAEEIDRAMPANSISRRQVYELPYADQCNASHSCYGTLEYALVRLDTDPHLHFGRMAPDVKPADLAYAAMIILIDDVIDLNGLDAALGERLKAINDRRRAHP